MNKKRREEISEIIEQLEGLMSEVESLKDEEAYVDLMKRLEALNSLENFRAWDQFQEEYSDDEEESEDTKENK